MRARFAIGARCFQHSPFQRHGEGRLDEYVVFAYTCRSYVLRRVWTVGTDGQREVDTRDTIIGIAKVDSAFLSEGQAAALKWLDNPETRTELWRRLDVASGRSRPEAPASIDARVALAKYLGLTPPPGVA